MLIIGKSGLSNRSVFAYILVFLIIIFAMTVLSYSISTERLEKELTNASLTLLKQINRSIDMNLKEIDREIINFSEEDEIRAFINDDFTNSIQRYEYFNKLMNKSRTLRITNTSIYSIYIYSDISKQILTHDTYCSVSDFYDNKWLEQYNSMTFYFSYLGTRKIVDSQSVNPIEKNVVTLIRPYPIASNPEYRRGAVIVNVDENVLYEFIKNDKPERLDTIFIMDREGRVLSHGDKENLYADLSEEPYISSILPLEGEGRINGRINGVSSSIFYINSTYTGWKYVSIVPHTQISAPLLTVRNILLLVALAMFGIAVATVIIVSKWTFKPVKKFMHSVSKKFEGIDIGRSQGKRYDSFEELEGLFSDILSDREKIQRQIQESLPAVKWRLIMDILTGYRTEYEELSAHLDLINVRLNRNYFVVMVAELDNQAELLQRNPSRGLRLYTDNLRSMAEEFANREQKGTAIEMNNGNVVMIMSFESADPAVNLGKAADTAKLVQSCFQEYFGMTVTVGIGSPYREMSEISLSFQEAVEALKYKIVTGNGSVISTGDIPTHSEKEMYKVFSMANAISASIKSANKPEVRRLIVKMFGEVMDKSFPPHMIRQLSLQMIVQGIRAAMDTGLSVDEIIEKDNRGAYEILDCCETAEQMQRYIEELFMNLMNRIIEKRQNSGNNELIAKVLEYIEQNYMNSELSLNMLADALHISVPYLSKIFKELSETNFLDYLITIRMKKAKELLSDSNKKVYEIAGKIGYTNTQSFIRIFKKYTGKTPNEYRSDGVLDSAAP